MTTTTPSRKKRLRCRLGMHKYVLRVSDDGGRFHECAHCGHFDPRSGSTGGGYIMG